MSRPGSGRQPGVPPSAGGGVGIDVGWMAYGKTSGSAHDYGVLRANRAFGLTPGDYDAIMRRFSPGTPPPRSAVPDRDGLPWVTIGHVPLRQQDAPDPRAARRSRAGSAGPGLLGMALQDWTDVVDVAGRPVVGTAYVCAPFEALAAGLVSYRGLYGALTADGGLRAALASGGPDTAVRLAPLLALDTAEIAGYLDGDPGRFRLAAGIAALLLSKPVALTGAAVASPGRRVEERLLFLDAVAALLPFGQRARLSAGTWADSGTSHRIRLAYSERARDGEAAVRLPSDDRVAALPTMPFPSADYFQLLVEVHRRVGAERVLGHLSHAAYRSAHAIEDPRHALLALSDLAGPTVFAARVLTPAKTRELTRRADALDGAERAQLLDQAAREEVTHAVDLLRVQQRRRRLLAGAATADSDTAVLRSVAARGPRGVAIIRELVLRAVADDENAVARGLAAPPGEGPLTPAQARGAQKPTAYTEGWLGWAAREPSLAAPVRIFADVVAGRPDPEEFARVARTANRNDALVMLRLSRLAGCSRPLRAPLWELLVTQFHRVKQWPTHERGAWARAITELPVGLNNREEAELDVCRMLLGAYPVVSLGNRMAAIDAFEYRACLLEVFEDLLRRYRDERGHVSDAGLDVVDRVMDGLAGSLTRDGWPRQSGQAADTLVLLAGLADKVPVYVSTGLRTAVKAQLDGGARVDDDLRGRWVRLLRTYDGPQPVPRS